MVCVCGRIEPASNFDVTYEPYLSCHWHEPLTDSLPPAPHSLKIAFYSIHQ